MNVRISTGPLALMLEHHQDAAFSTFVRHAAHAEGVADGRRTPSGGVLGVLAPRSVHGVAKQKCFLIFMFDCGGELRYEGSLRMVFPS